MKNIIKRTKRIVNLKYFNQINKPFKIMDYYLNCPWERQYVLRMKIKEPHNDFKIPMELEWLNDLIYATNNYQENINIRHGYCYVTIRNGKVTSETDDEWHTDGYSEVITHIPEQNYIITNKYPTEYITIKIKFPKNFNALKHNITEYLNHIIQLRKPKIKKLLKNCLYLIDPYIIHRRPLNIEGKKRTFVRITYVPIEIADDACTQNPLFDKKIFNRTANTTRNRLINYKG